MLKLFSAEHKEGKESLKELILLNVIYFTLLTLTLRTQFYDPSGNKILYSEAQVFEIHTETFAYVNHVYKMRKILLLSTVIFSCLLNVFDLILSYMTLLD